jgi:sporadic carbohydrate cluster 2OG-Fe(II) oxygenase
MPIIEKFDVVEDDAACAAFLRDGYVIVEAENRDGLDRIRALAAGAARAHLGLPLSDDDGRFLDNIHEHVAVDSLNDVRLAAINALRGAEWFRPTYFSLARSAIHRIVGNELAMQRGIGLSVQLPDDESSLLPIHADVWDGDSPFEVVLWVPLVDCHRTKSMYILPLEQDRARRADVVANQYTGAEALYQTVADEIRFLDVPYGSVLLFSQTLMHGNRVNQERETRWSMNCRFKSTMSPYADKKLGEFFEPITFRPASVIGLSYQMPSGFHE